MLPKHAICDMSPVWTELNAITRSGIVFAALSVCLSVTFMYTFKIGKQILKLFTTCGSHTILGFLLRNANVNSCAIYRMVPFSMTSNDPNPDFNGTPFSVFFIFFKI